jgi:hypothetical protein
MKRGQAVSYEQLNSALFDVQDELYGVGLWYEGAPLTETEVYWCAWPQLDVPFAGGFFIDGLWGISGALARLLGYEAGHIYIPAWILLHAFWQSRGSLRAVIRHEYGHAIIYRHPREGRSKAFRDVFGGAMMRISVAWAIILATHQNMRWLIQRKISQKHSNAT